jgi:hypothetical protein
MNQLGQPLGQRLGDRHVGLEREFKARDSQRLERVLGIILWLALLLTLFGLGAR